MEPLTRDDARLLLTARAYLYELAHTVFSGEPDERLIGAIANDFTDGALRLATDEPNDAYDRLRVYLADRAPVFTEGNRLDELKSSYMRLVEGPDLNDAYPWESMYVSHRRLLFQKSTLEVREAYREFGYELQERGKVPDDHLSLECAFMAKMAEKTLEVWDVVFPGQEDGASKSASEDAFAPFGELRRLLDGQERFLNDHATRWFSLYAADLGKNDEGSMYALVANMIAAFVRDDLSAIAAVRSCACGGRTQ